MDAVVQTNDRTAEEKSYAIWVRERVEADEELANLSADDLVAKKAKMKFADITPLERMLYELKFFMETGKHLDIQNVTLCSGSRDSGGHVPRAYWRGSRFEVDWDYLDSRDSSLRSREVVTLAP